MNKAETIKLFTVISAMFPRDSKFAQADQLMIDMWQKMLADISYDSAEKAIAAAVSTSPFPRLQKPNLLSTLPSECG